MLRCLLFKENFTLKKIYGINASHAENRGGGFDHHLCNFVIIPALSFSCLFFFQLVLKINDTFESKRGKKRVKLQPYTGKEAPSSKGRSRVCLSVCSISV